MSNASVEVQGNFNVSLLAHLLLSVSGSCVPVRNVNHCDPPKLIKDNRDHLTGNDMENKESDKVNNRHSETMMLMSVAPKHHMDS